MKRARLIKKAELTKPKPSALTSTPSQAPVSNTQSLLTQWVGAYHTSRCPNPRVAFAALFTTEA